MTSTERVAGDAPAVAAFVAKWRMREPEMVYAEVFSARPLRMRFAVWGALLFELREAAFELSDARLIEAKSAWWADELLRCAQGAPRHPLTQALATPQLAELDLTWNALAHGMLAMAHADASRPVDRDAALAAIAPLAEGIAMVEAALFDATMTSEATRMVAVHLLCERLRVGLDASDGGRVPLSLLARHAITGSELAQPQGAPAVADWAGELAAAQPSDFAGVALYRATRSAFDTWFLRELATGHPHRALPRLRALRLAWHAARQARRTV
ncbi:MAG TPA: hypothetical protein VGT79_08240 [Xanthomonadaceae bacterium]|nr:hypothetical protein [Xanthomonadaceae bacterium]